MLLRRNTKKREGADYDCWTLVDSIRTARGPRQRIVASIGKLPGLDREERIGWEEIIRILSGKPHPTPGLFEQREEPPSWATVNMSGVSVERLRSFGDIIWDCFYGTSLALRASAGIIFLPVAKRFPGRSWRLFWFLRGFAHRLRN
jgi:hypothetical protein